MSNAQSRKSSFILGLVLVLSGGLFGASEFVRSDEPPVIDHSSQELVIARVSAIQRQIFLCVAGYSELDYLHPAWVQITHIDPNVFVDIELDSFFLSSVSTRTSSNGTLRIARRGEDEILLRIKAQYKTRSLPSEQYRPLGRPSTWWQGKLEVVHREELPGTDITITVDAASNDGIFPRLVRQCLEKSPESMKTEIAGLIHGLEIAHTSSRAALMLVKIGEYAPVIAALTNSDLTIQRSAIVALADFNHNAEDGTVIKTAVPPLIQLLKSSDSYERYLVARTLGHVHQEDQIAAKALIVATDDESEQVSTAALLSLGEFKSQETKIVPAVIKKLSDARPAVRAQATQTLGQVSPCRDPELIKAVVSALIKSLADSDKNVRIGAAWALGDNGRAAKDAWPVLLKLTSSDDNELRNQVRAALMHIDFEAAKKAGLVD